MNTKRVLGVALIVLAALFTVAMFVNNAVLWSMLDVLAIGLCAAAGIVMIKDKTGCCK